MPREDIEVQPAGGSKLGLTIQRVYHGLRERQTFRYGCDFGEAQVPPARLTAGVT
jgi:hypothetical protein